MRSIKREPIWKKPAVVLSSGLTSQSEPQVAERFLEANGPLSVGMAQLGQAFGEHLLGTDAILADKATH